MSFELTFDYELFGNGEGCLYENLILPTSKILSILARSGESAIFYIEGLEFSRLEKAGVDVSGIKRQVQNIVLSGHELGLHIHPQWLVDHDEARKRNVNLSSWSAANLGSEYDDCLNALQESLDFIQSSVGIDCQIVRFRAGGYNACPSPFLGKALQALGIHVDSSVVPGMFRSDNYNSIDYTMVTSFVDYPCAIDDFRCVDKSSMFTEEPISSVKGRRLLSISISSVLMRLNKIGKIEFGKISRNDIFPVDIGMFNSLYFLYFLFKFRGSKVRVISHPKTIKSFLAFSFNLQLLKSWSRLK